MKWGRERRRRRGGGVKEGGRAVEMESEKRRMLDPTVIRGNEKE